MRRSTVTWNSVSGCSIACTMEPTSWSSRRGSALVTTAMGGPDVSTARTYSGVADSTCSHSTVQRSSAAVELSHTHMMSVLAVSRLAIPVMPPRMVSANATDRMIPRRFRKSLVACQRLGVSMYVCTRAMFSSGYAAPPTHNSRLPTRRSIARNACGGVAGGGGMSGNPDASVLSTRVRIEA